jgi:hypothetical protein
VRRSRAERVLEIGRAASAWPAPGASSASSEPTVTAESGGASSTNRAD